MRRTPNQRSKIQSRRLKEIQFVVNLFRQALSQIKLNSNMCYNQYFFLFNIKWILVLFFRCFLLSNSVTFFTWKLQMKKHNQSFIKDGCYIVCTHIYLIPDILSRWIIFSRLENWKKMFQNKWYQVISLRYFYNISCEIFMNWWYIRYIDCVDTWNSPLQPSYIVI